jgi:hypothetical protein
MAVSFHLRRMLSKDTAQCYGADSVIAKCEKRIDELSRRNFLKCRPDLSGVVNPLRDEKIIPWADCPDYINTPLEESAFGGTRFVANMNYLLKWAGLPELTEKEL